MVETLRLKHLRRLLLTKKKELEARLAELEQRIGRSQQEASGDLSAYPLHMADLGTDAGMREEEAILIDSIVKELGMINHALEKLDSDTYGKCEKCGNDIPEERLRVIPYAEFCAKCGKIVTTD